MIIELNRGYHATIDDDDYELVSHYTWSVWETHGKMYAVTGTHQGRGNNVILMHRLIMGLPDDQVDHIDGDGLNNRRSNLRIVTPAQQSYNKLPQKNKIHSEYKGVTWFYRDKKWKAQIMQYGVNYHLGYFDNETDAAKAYDNAAKEKFGEYARTNF